MFLGLESVKICRLDLEVDLLNFFKKRQAIGGASNHNFLTKMNIIAYLISCLHHPPPSLNPLYFVLLTLAQTIYNSLERKINGSSLRLLAQGRRSIGLQVLIKVLLDAGFFMHAVITVLSIWPAWLWCSMALWGRLPCLG